MNITIDGRATIQYSGTGMGTYTRNLIQGLHQQGQRQCNILLPNHKQVNISDIKTYWEQGQENPKFWQSAYENPAPSNLICDIFHNTHNGFGIPQGADFPIVSTIHDVIPLIMPEFCGSPYKEIFEKEILNYAQTSNHIIAVSERTKADIISYLKIPPKKITVIYQGTDDIFQPLNPLAVSDFLQKKYQIKKDFILYVGGFNPRKNILNLVKAFTDIKDEVPCDLLILGKEGKRSEKIKEYAFNLGLQDRIKFMGYIPREDLPFFYNGAKIFIYPSLYEGFGLPPLEAASCGTAVIVSNTAALPEIMSNCGIYINPQRKETISKAILELYPQDKELISLGQEGINRARQFSPLIAAEKTLAVYGSLCR